MCLFQREDGWKTKHIGKYADAVSNLHNQGESSETLEEYKKAVLSMLNLNTDTQLSQQGHTSTS